MFDDLMLDDLMLDDWQHCLLEQNTLLQLINMLSSVSPQDYPWITSKNASSSFTHEDI